MRTRLPALLLALAGCNGDAPGEWTAIVYADASNHEKWQATPRFQSFELCRSAALESIRALPDPGKASYACGFQCGTDPGSPDPARCKEMKS